MKARLRSLCCLIALCHVGGASQSAQAHVRLLKGRVVLEVERVQGKDRSKRSFRLGIGRIPDPSRKHVHQPFELEDRVATHRWNLTARVVTKTTGGRPSSRLQLQLLRQDGPDLDHITSQNETTFSVQDNKVTKSSSGWKQQVLPHFGRAEYVNGPDRDSRRYFVRLKPSQARELGVPENREYIVEYVREGGQRNWSRRISYARNPKRPGKLIVVRDWAPVGEMPRNYRPFTAAGSGPNHNDVYGWLQ